MNFGGWISAWVMNRIYEAPRFTRAAGSGFMTPHPGSGSAICLNVMRMDYCSTGMPTELHHPLYPPLGERRV